MDGSVNFAGKRACVVGAGFGGLALAIRLQAAGVATTLVEARDRAGGVAYTREKDGFTFDCGPTILTNTATIGELWAISGHALEDDLELLPVRPSCRFHWNDGQHFDLTIDDTAMRKEVARVSPGDLHGFEDYLLHAQELQKLVTLSPATVSGLPTRLLREAPALLRHRSWNAAWKDTARFVQDPQLRQALTAHMLMRGANPCQQGSNAVGQFLALRETGAWCARGGTGRLVTAMQRQFERLGGTIRLHDPVTALHLLGNRVQEVETQSGWRERFDAVASNADMVHTYRDLLSRSDYGHARARQLANRPYSPGCISVHFALEGSWPGIPHSMVLFGPRFEGLIADIFDHGVLPQDQIIFLTHPSVTDPLLAPEGKSVFQAVVPVANMGRLTVDWEQIGPMLERRIIEEVGRRLVPDIADRIITSFHLTPRDYALDLNAHLGSAFGLMPRPLSPRRGVGHRDRKIVNLFRVGASTMPGGGVPNVLAGAKSASHDMFESLSQ